MANKILLRKPLAADAAALGRICFEAFNKIAEDHRFPSDFPNAERATGLMKLLIDQPGIYGVAAEIDGSLVGSNFLWEADAVAGVGPITVDVNSQNGAVGKALMTDALRRANEKGFLSVRLVQSAYHSRSLSLYSKLGFDAVEPLSLIQGNSPGISIDGFNVRAMTMADLSAADALAARVHGHTRHNETKGAIERGTALVVEHDGRITGYSTVVGFFGHSIGETNEDMKAMIGASDCFPGSGFLLPTKNGNMLRWCLEHGLKIVQPMTLMSRGVYQEPRGSFLPSIVF